MTTTTLNHNDERQTKRSLFLGIVVWFAHLNVTYALPSLSCKWGWFPFTVGPLSGLQFVQTILTIVALAAMAVLIYLPWRDWRKFQSEKPPQNPQMLKDTEESRPPMLAAIVMGSNAFFLVFIVAAFVPIFALSACAQA